MSRVRCHNIFLFFIYFFSWEASRWRVCYQRGLPHLVNRPGVAGAVLQNLRHSLINSESQPFAPDLQNIITPKPLELEI